MININIIAADSMGVRSMATLVETGKLRVAIDPSAALGPTRYGLGPHRLELEELNKRLKTIKEHAKNSDVIIISHYHYDHYDPDADFYREKIVIVKDWKSKINHSQKKRANSFIPQLETMAKEVIVGDNNTIEIGDVILSFSPPLYHGPEGSKLGWVISTLVDNGDETFLHTSDVQGPLTDTATNWIISSNPDVVFLCGCLTYFLGWRYPTSLLDTANNNVRRILEKTKVQTLIVDHHLVRDKNFRKKIAPAYETARKLNKRIVTGAQFMGEKERFLEAFRKELWAGQKM